jgi:glycine/serine hydroxymethyltransferase
VCAQTIAAIAVALKQVNTQAFRDYSAQILLNTKTIAKVLLSHNYKLQTDGSDNHLVLWDLRPLGLTGSKIEKICDLVHITLNKNSVPGDKSATVPGGVRVGTNSLTSRSMFESEMEVVADFLHRAVQIAYVLCFAFTFVTLDSPSQSCNQSRDPRRSWNQVTKRFRQVSDGRRRTRSKGPSSSITRCGELRYEIPLTWST